jgi:hypothetical protein
MSPPDIAIVAESEDRHALKNHLSIVIGYADLLLRELPRTDPRHHDVCELRLAAQNARLIVEKLLVSNAQPVEEFAGEPT